MAEKKTLKGFGPTKSGAAMSGFKTLGKMLSKQGIRPVGGNAGGCTGGGKAAGGEHKMGQIGSGQGIVGGGKGKASMPKISHNVTLKPLGSAMGKGGLGEKDVRPQPE